MKPIKCLCCSNPVEMGWLYCLPHIEEAARRRYDSWRKRRDHKPFAETGAGHE